MFKVKKTLSLLLSLSLLISFSACKKNDDIFIDESLLVPEKAEYQEIMVQKGDYLETVSTSIELVYSYNNELTFGENGYFEEFYVNKGDYVKKDDIIASYTLGNSTISLEEKKLALQNVKNEYQTAVNTYNSNMEYQKQVLADFEKDSYEYKIQALKIKSLSTSHSMYKCNANKTIENLEKDIENLKEEQELYYLKANYDGQITSLSVLEKGDIVNQNTIIARLVSASEYMFEVKNDKGFRWGDIVDVEATLGTGKQSLKAKVITASNILSADLSDVKTYLAIDYEASGISKEDFDLSYKNIKASANSIYIEDVLLVDQDAVNSYDGKYYINILNDQSLRKRYITSDYHNSNYYWVADGLSENQTIVIKK